MEKYKFPKSDRVLKKKEFLFYYEKAKKFSSKYSIIFILENEKKTKLGISVSKKIGNAVCRNKIKRIYREIFRLNKENIIQGLIILISAKENIINVKYKDIKEDIINFLEKKEYIKKVYS